MSIHVLFVGRRGTRKRKRAVVKWWLSRNSPRDRGVLELPSARLFGSLPVARFLFCQPGDFSCRKTHSRHRSFFVYGGRDSACTSGRRRIVSCTAKWLISLEDFFSCMRVSLYTRSCDPAAIIRMTTDPISTRVNVICYFHPGRKIAHTHQ